MSRVAARGRLLAPGAVLAVVSMAWAPRAAQACSVCMSGTEDANRLAFILTTVLLTVLPLAMVGGLVWWLRRRVRQLEQAPLRAETAQPAPALSRASSSP